MISINSNIIAKKTVVIRVVIGACVKWSIARIPYKIYTAVILAGVPNIPLIALAHTPAEGSR